MFKKSVHSKNKKYCFHRYLIETSVMIINKAGLNVPHFKIMSNCNYIYFFELPLTILPKNVLTF
jgi:hypothetical protein